MRTKGTQFKNEALGCIINCHQSKELCTRIIAENHKTMFSKNFVVAYSVSGNGTKVACSVTESSRNGSIAGVAHPNHFIQVPSPPRDCADFKEIEKDFIVSTLEKFNREKTVMEKSSEVNLATLTHQAVEGQVSKLQFLHVYRRPQTNNQALKFNELVAEAAMDADAALRKEGREVSFISFATGAISDISSFIRTTSRQFLTGNTACSARTTTNHNMKNGRHQCVVGGESEKNWNGPY